MEWEGLDEREERADIVKLVLNGSACETPAGSSFQLVHGFEEGCDLSSDYMS